MTTYFPEDIFKNILSYCDDTIERKQRNLWKKIKPVRFEHNYDGMNIPSDKYNVDEEGKVDQICIGYIDEKNEQGYHVNWVIEYDNWELSDNLEYNVCLQEVLEHEDFWKSIREYNNMTNLSRRQDRCSIIPYSK